MDQLAEVLSLTATRLEPDFVGLGLILYDALVELPFVALSVAHDENPRLPVCGARDIAEVLRVTSRRSSPWHDGFHFIDAETGCLTHLCQFVAPSVSLLNGATASGARHMTALLASKIKGIRAVGLLAESRLITIYTAGSATTFEFTR